MTHAGFENAADVRTFLAGGNAKLTLSSAATGNHYTYHIKQGWDHDANKRDTSTPFFVYVRNGPDPDDYMYIGFIPKGTTELAAGKKGCPEAESFNALSWTLGHLANDTIPDQLTIQHSGSCSMCGRELTVPESIATGLGPVCRAKLL